MRAVLYEAFTDPLKVTTVPDPTPSPRGVIIKVMATGLCRSDWHGWMGHDPDISLPHIPGHELAGIIEAVGENCHRWKVGDRVTVPFVGGCGRCQQCNSGNQQICDDQFQPGFTAWGSFAEYVHIERADINLVKLPDMMEFSTAASLGCRFITSFRAVIDQGQVRPGQWVAVHGCGGVGLSAIMIAAAMGAQVIAVDIGDEQLEFAKSLGAIKILNGLHISDIPKAIYEITKGGAHLSIDAIGHRDACFNSIACLRKQGRHIQIGLMAGKDESPPIPMDLIIARELEILGSHGMQAHRYNDMFHLIENGILSPSKLVNRTISLDDAPRAVMTLDQFEISGITVITKF